MKQQKYKSWKTIERELERAMKENNGEFPASDRLLEMGRSDLCRLTKYYGGFPAVRKKMGYEEVQKPNGYYKNWNNVKKDLEKAIKENKQEFPSEKKLRKMGKKGLAAAVYEHWEGFPAVRKKMGYKLLRLPNGYYKNWNNVKKELEILIKQNKGEFPSGKKLRKLGYSSLAASFSECHGGFPAVRQKMGYEIVQKPPRYWQTLQNFEKELKKAIEMNKGNFPTQEVLIKLEKQDLIHAMAHYGGMEKVREKWGYKLLKKPYGYWQSFKNIKKELKEAIKENNGKFPSGKRLIEMGYSALSSIISKYPGGSQTLRKKLGYKPVKKPDEYYKNWSNIEKDLRKAIEKNKGEFPSQIKLREMGYSSLAASFSKYYGGIHSVREKTGHNDRMMEKVARELEGILEGVE